ncbi:hypothetical protein DUNSADRAFT_6005 [Dunaliella salina]|uniref:Flavin reductase like domain-containing protein n=1 Tax=Dunaliella salina TaxID=3046 RepID=A0ABQ7GP45_DUNSA|nr:hypothetical protein DUNSADRAFT_6005 [Dunaliella salina]|eukprot:KAF5836369.1 hypothetical protein DUNSADRAFT_6005 [Dunaliella salina]
MGGGNAATLLTLGAVAGSSCVWALPKLFKLCRRCLGSPTQKPSQPHFVAMPHPDWKPSVKQPPPFGEQEYILYDPATMDKASSYALVISAIVPRPIALVSSLSKNGAQNVAPYSYFNVMGHAPPVFCIGINRSPSRGGAKKDTLTNIEESGQFVVNIMSDWYVEAANHTCGDYDPDVDEMSLSGLTPEPSQRVTPPRIKEAAVQMECKLRQVVDVHDASGNPTTAIVIGEVLLFHISKGVATQSPTGKLIVDPTKLRPISRLGGTIYGTSTQLFEIGRPTKAQMHMGAAEYTGGAANSKK